MAAITRRSPNATLVTQSAIDKASDALEDLPEKPKDKLSLREAVETLREPIIAALEKGYSYEDIAAMLAKQGVTIAPSSLKHYLARSNRQLKAKGTRTQTRRKSAAAQTDQPESSPASPTEPVAQTTAKRGRPKATKATAPEPTPPEAAPEEPPKRGRRASGTPSQTAAKSTPTRSTTRGKSTAASSTRKRRG
jgi:hypothetical protein